MKKNVVLFSAMIIGLCFTPLSMASEKNAYDLGEIVVSDRSNSSETAATLHTITSSEIQAKGVRTLDEALKLIPGIYIRYGAAGAPRIDIRGLRTRHVLLLLNGIPIKDTYDDQFDPTTIPVDHIEKIKVTTGGSSVLYGTGGSAGVINIITKKAGEGVHGSVMSEFGSEGYFSGNALLTAGNQKVGGVISVGTTQRDATLLSDDFEENDMQPDDTRENSDHERQTVFAGLDYDASDVFSIGFTLNYQDGENGTPPSTINDKKDTFAPSIKYDRIDEIKTCSFQTAFDYQFQAPLQFRGWAFVSQGDTVSNRYDDDTYTTMDQKGSYFQDATSRVTGVNLQLAYTPCESDTFSFAVIMEKDSWDADGFEIDKKGKKQTFSLDTELTYYSLALEYTSRPLDKLGLVLGYGFHAMEKEVGEDEEDFSLMAGLSYDICDNTIVKGSWSRSIRFPNTKQLYDVSGGNADLSAETIYTWEIGVSHAFSFDTTVAVTGYIKDANDFIEKDLDDLYRNYEEYRFKGVEIEVTNTSIENLTLTGTATLMTSEDKSENSEKDELQNRPEKMVSLEGTYAFPFGLKAHASLLYVADQYYYSRQEPLEKAELDDYTVLDLKISQALFNDTIELFVRAENLFDELYSQSYGFPCSGRTLYAGAKYRF